MAAIRRIRSVNRKRGMKNYSLGFGVKEKKLFAYGKNKKVTLYAHLAAPNNQMITDPALRAPGDIVSANETPA
jgi:hypothetical protein